jgi:hypothetical protein
MMGIKLFFISLVLALMVEALWVAYWLGGEASEVDVPTGKKSNVLAVNCVQSCGDKSVYVDCMGRLENELVVHLPRDIFVGDIVCEYHKSFRTKNFLWRHCD